MSRSVDFKYGYMEISNGILYCTYKPFDLVDLEIMKVCVAERIKLCDGQSYPSFFDPTRVHRFTREARVYAANEGNHLVSASAILVDSKMLKVIANLYIILHKPLNPTQIFSDKTSAVEWLETFKREEFKSNSPRTERN